MTETDRIVNVVLSRYEAQLIPPTKDYPFATVIPLPMRWVDKVILAGLALFCFAGLACMIRGACDYAGEIWRAL